MLDVIIVLVFVAALVFFFRRQRMKDLARMDESLTLQNIESDLVVWAAEHPGSDFSHPEAQRIIRRCIKRMNELRRQDPEIAEEKIARLIKLLN